MDNALAQIAVGLTTALISVIGSMTALLKWYLPKHDERLHNPHLTELQSINANITQVNTQLAEMAEDGRKRHKAVVECLDGIDHKITKHASAEGV